MRRRCRVGRFAVAAGLLAAAIVCAIGLSGVAAARSGPPKIDVRVVHADRFCTSRTGYTLRRCPRTTNGLIRLGGPTQQWLLIFSFTAPRSSAAHGRTYYFFTADAPGLCPNAEQFGEYGLEVRRDQRVVGWFAFDKRCPGPGHAAIRLIRSRTKHPVPGEGASRLVASFKFSIP